MKDIGLRQEYFKLRKNYLAFIRRNNLAAIKIPTAIPKKITRSSISRLKKEYDKLKNEKVKLRKADTFRDVGKTEPEFERGRLGKSSKAAEGRHPSGKVPRIKKEQYSGKMGRDGGRAGTGERKQSKYQHKTKEDYYRPEGDEEARNYKRVRSRYLRTIKRWGLKGNPRYGIIPAAKRKTKSDTDELEEEIRKIKSGHYSYITGSDKPVDTLENIYDRLRANYNSYINRYGLVDYERIPVPKEKTKEAIAELEEEYNHLKSIVEEYKQEQKDIGVNLKDLEPKPEPPAMVDVILARLEEMINTWRPEHYWSQWLASKKKQDRDSAALILQGAIEKFGREAVAARCEEVGEYLISLLNEILYDSDAQYGKIDGDLALLVSFLWDRMITPDEAKELSDTDSETSDEAVGKGEYEV